MNSKYEPNIRLTFKNEAEDDQKNGLRGSQRGNVE